MGHLIHRQILEVSFASQAEAQRWSGPLAQLNEKIILPEIERLFDELPVGDSPLRIERLEIDLGQLSPQHLEEELGKQLRAKLQEALLHTLPASAASVDSVFATALQKRQRKPAEGAASLDADSLAELFAVFLQHGRLPWWLDKSLAQQLDALYRRYWELAPARARRQLQQTLVGPLPRRRFIEQFSSRSHRLTLEGLLPESLAQLFADLRRVAVALLQGRKSADESRIGGLEVACLLLAEVRLNSEDQRLALSRRFLALLADWSGVPEAELLTGLDRAAGRSRLSAETRQVLGQLLRGQLAPSELHWPQTAADRQTSAIEPDENEAGPLAEPPEKELELVSENAGLVLLWPYLAELLRKLELLEKSSNGAERPTAEAVLLLQQLVSGRPAAQEPQLALNKLLCGWPLNAPVPRRLRRSARWDAEVETMLSTVISHWAALKSTSVPGFRAAFLQREGLLRQGAVGWTLRVERQAHDILLEQLPWGIGMIRLSWMRQTLQVEW